MKVQHPILATIATALLLSIGCQGAPQKSPEELRAERLAVLEEDMQSMVKKVMNITYPALVFVKPIQKTFDRGKEEQRQIFGSGAIISEDGYVVTNNHVAEKATQIKCVLYDKREVVAEVVGLDRDTDIAVLKLDPKDLKENEKLPYIKFGNSDALMVGQPVMALGCPLGYEQSVTQGIVSNKERYLDDIDYNLWIQTDAPINPGNSGGPLVNTTGEIVGINTLKASWGENIGFSIPSNIVADVVKEIVEAKKVTRSWTGLRIQDLKEFSKSSTITATEGCLVAGIEPNSPAQKSGIQAGDIILKVNESVVNVILPQHIPAAKRFFAKLPIGKSANLTINRKGSVLAVALVPEEKGKAEGDDFECKEWGMTLKEISKFSPTVISFFRKRGAFVYGVKGDGNAAASGFYPADILVKIDGKDVESLDAVKKIYEEQNKKKIGERKCLVEVIRFGYPAFVVLDFNTKGVDDKGKEPRGGK